MWSKNKCNLFLLYNFWIFSQNIHQSLLVRLYIFKSYCKCLILTSHWNRICRMYRPWKHEHLELLLFHRKFFLLILWMHDRRTHVVDTPMISVKKLLYYKREQRSDVYSGDKYPKIWNQIVEKIIPWGSFPKEDLSLLQHKEKIFHFSPLLHQNPFD